MPGTEQATTNESTFIESGCDTAMIKGCLIIQLFASFIVTEYPPAVKLEISSTNEPFDQLNTYGFLPPETLRFMEPFVP